MSRNKHAVDCILILVCEGVSIQLLFREVNVMTEHILHGNSKEYDFDRKKTAIRLFI